MQGDSSNNHQSIGRVTWWHQYIAQRDIPVHDRTPAFSLTFSTARSCIFFWDAMILAAISTILSKIRGGQELMYTARRSLLHGVFLRHTKVDGPQYIVWAMIHENLYQLFKFHNYRDAYLSKTTDKWRLGQMGG